MSTTLSYHQPTCELEVAAEFLPLSQTLPRAPVRSLHFTLHLGQQLTVTGNDRQLYRLKTAVNTYIDALLSRRVTPVTVREDNISLRSRSLLEHELHWPEHEVVALKLTELYDLATVLDDWSAAMQPLPELVATSQAKLAQIPIWLKSTAIAVGVLAVFTLSQQWLLRSPMPLSQAPIPTDQASLPSLTTPLPLPEPTLNPELAPLPTTPEAPPATPPSTTELVPLPPPPEMPPPAVLPPPPIAAVEPAPVPDQNPDQNNVVVESPQSRVSTGISAAPIAPPASSSVSATTLREVKTYFQDRWQPPTSLDTSLEYRLVLNPDGSLAQALPLNGAAVRFIDRTPIPLRESPLASPFGSNQPILLRLVLMPSGTVQVFGES